MTTSTVNYTGDMRSTCTHVRSNQAIITDAPVDNHGKGEAFSPTDLLATSLATCALTTVAILGKAKNINIDGANAEVIKHMASDPRRVAKIEVHIHMPDNNYTNEEKEFIKTTIFNCPVAKSLHPDLIQAIEIKW
jgi:uncharacterized OsmC-like protein